MLEILGGASVVSIFARLREESPKMKFTINDGGGGGRRETDEKERSGGEIN